MIGSAAPEALSNRAGNAWVTATTDTWLDVEDPSTGEVFARVPDSDVDDVDRVVSAAREGFDAGPWPRMSATERAGYLLRIADRLESELPSVVAALGRDTGCAARLNVPVQVFTPIQHLRDFASMAPLLETPRAHPIGGAVGQGQWEVTREPVGVVVAFVPYNFPLFMAVWKFAPAALAGNTVVLKASPLTPIGTQELARACEAVGLPDGVINIVHGDASAGQHLVEHPGVDLVSFTGSTEVGKQIMAGAATTLKPVLLELGGKSPALVLDDANLELAVRGTLFSSMLHAGQACVATTRMLVPSALYDEAVERAATLADALIVGPAADEAVDVGPLISARQRSRVESFVEAARADGATVAAGGTRPDDVPAGGYYYRPTILSEVSGTSRVAQEEIFGPVLSVIRYDELDEGLAIANNTRYGLAASVWGEDIGRAREIAGQLQAGLVWVNDAGQADVRVSPVAGRNQSGIGAELGPEGLLAYTLPKSIYTALDRAQLGMYSLVGSGWPAPVA